MKVGNDVNRDKQETPFIFFTVRETAQGKKKKKTGSRRRKYLNRGQHSNRGVLMLFSSSGQVVGR